MTPEERQMLGGLFQRVNSAAATQRDPEADPSSMTRFAPRPTRPMCWRKPCSFSSRLWRPLRTGSPNSRRPRSREPGRPEEQGSFLGNLGKSIFGAGPSSPPPRPDPDPHLSARGAPAAARLRAARASRRLSPAAPAGLSAATGPVGPASAAFGRRRLPAECSFDRDGRGRRRGPWQSAGRPVWRPWRRRRALWRRGKRRLDWAARA